MVGAIDAVCDVAQRIIGKLKEGTSGEGPPLLGAALSAPFLNGAVVEPPTGERSTGAECDKLSDR